MNLKKMAAIGHGQTHLKESHDHINSNEFDALAPTISAQVGGGERKIAILPIQQEAFTLGGRCCHSAGGHASMKKGSTANTTLWNSALLDQPSGVSSFVFRRLRLISPLAAVTRKPAVLSLSSFSCSISSITSCGIRTVVICDFAFFAPVAIAETPYIRCMSVYAKKMIIKGLKCISLEYSVKHKGEIHLVSAKPGSVSPLTGPLTTNDRISIEGAMQNHTTPLIGRYSLTPNKFTWRFLALNRHDKKAKPCSLSVIAHTEREARQVLAPHFILSLAARLPIREVPHA